MEFSVGDYQDLLHVSDYPSVFFHLFLWRAAIFFIGENKRKIYKFQNYSIYQLQVVNKLTNKRHMTQELGFIST